MPPSPPSAPRIRPDLVIVGVSGGVDSAVAALLLKEAGHAVEGLFMSNWEDDDDAYCTTASDWQDARRVCDTLKIPLHRASFAGEYRDRVFAHFLREYAAGRTPNPDVLCNREIKFGVCLDYMHRLGAAKIATGHYARVVTGTGTLPGDRTARLLKAADGSKDQSYFLHSVNPVALAGIGLRVHLEPIEGGYQASITLDAHAITLEPCWARASRHRHRGRLEPCTFRYRGGVGPWPALGRVTF